MEHNETLRFGHFDVADTTDPQLRSTERIRLDQLMACWLRRCGGESSVSAWH
jgi:hypothetical protein